LAVPLMVTFHGYDATDRGRVRDGLWAWRYGRRRERLGERATRVVAVSEHVRAALIDGGFPPALIRTHYIGVDLARFKPGSPQERAPIVLGVGRFVEKKGFEVLVDAMAEVQRELPYAELVLIGSGPLGTRIGKRASALLRSFRILGPCDGDAVGAWMRRARVLAVPSVTSPSGDTEGLPISLIEGLASGLPIVATRHAGIPEAVQHELSGLLVGERDRSALAAAITRVLADDAGWKRMSAASRKTAERKFDLSVQTAALEGIYSEIASRSA
jgi:glycosyltransferase involved in cell wall biosynthesis